MSKADGEGKEQLKLTVKEVGEAIQEKPNIIRNWMRDFKEYIPLEKATNGYNLFDEEALKVMREIKALHREQNYSIAQIKYYFESGGEVFKPVDSNELIENELKKIREEFDLQRQFNKRLLEKLDEQQKFIDQRLLDRDHKLMEYIRDRQEETRKEIASGNEAEKVEKKSSIFKRLFKNK